jgi:hypothetical protein
MLLFTIGKLFLDFSSKINGELLAFEEYLDNHMKYKLFFLRSHLSFFKWLLAQALFSWEVICLHSSLFLFFAVCE